MPIASPPTFCITLAAVEFVAAGWLLGSISVAGPILAHLSRHRRGERVMFPAVRFLREAVIRRRNHRRPSDLLLLISRILIILLIAAAFSQPVWKSNKPISLSLTSDPMLDQQIVIIVDASASMRRMDSGRTLFARAQSLADDLLDELSGRVDRVAIVMAAGSQTRAIFPRMSSNIEALRSALATETPTFQHAQLGEAFALAATMPAGESRDQTTAIERGGMNREVVVFTDAQRSEWDSVDASGSLKQSFRNVTVVNVRPAKDEPNFSIREISVEPGHPVIGESVSISADLTMDAEPKDEPQDVDLRLDFGGRLFDRTVGEMKPGETRRVTAQILLKEKGLIPFNWRVRSNDRFPIDDRCESAVRVRDKQYVAIFTHVPEGSSRSAATEIALDELDPSSAAFLLASALQPSDDSPVRVSVLDSRDQLADEVFRNPSSLDTIIIAEAERISSPDLRVLSQFIKQGGGVLWIADSAKAVSSMQEFERLYHSDIESNNRTRSDSFLPIVPNSWIDSFDESLRSTAGLGAHVLTLRSPSDLLRSQSARSLLKLIGDRALQSLLQCRFASRAIGKTNSSAETLLEFEDGTPALLTGRIGPGRMTVFTGALGPNQSTLTRNPVFVPFIHEIIKTLRPSAELIPHVQVGDSIRIPSRILIDDPGLLRISPKWANTNVEVARTLADSKTEKSLGVKDSGYIRIPFCAQPGLIQIIDQPTSELIGAGAVDFDERESKLRSFSADELREMADRIGGGNGSSGSIISIDSSDESAGTRRTDSSTTLTSRILSRLGFSQTVVKLWPWCIVFVLVLLAVENLFQIRISQANGRPDERMEVSP